MKEPTLKERIIKIEILMQNHLEHHKNIMRYLLFPILVGMALTIFKLYVLK
ncbi:MAG: hypothetical protein ABIL39_10730 [candidate division WOR-3 bacterium]